MHQGQTDDTQFSQYVFWWIFDPLTFTTLWANSADDNLLVFLNYHSLNKLLFFN